MSGKKQEIPYKDLINGGCKIFESGVQLGKEKDVEKNVGGILTTAGGVAMAFGGPVGMIAGGVLCGMGAIMICSAPSSESETSKLKKQMQSMLSKLSLQMDENHKETMQKLNILEQLIFSGFFQVKRQLVLIEDKCNEILAHQLKDWNTKELKNFEAHFKTFLEKRHVYGDDSAYEYIKKYDPMYFNNMLDPDYLEKWIVDLRGQQQHIGLQFMAIQDFIKYRWMTFLLVFYQAKIEKSQTGVDPIIYTCQKLKDDMKSYYQIYRKYLVFKYEINYIGLEQETQLRQNDFNFDSISFLEAQDKNIDQYKISRIEIQFCHWESIRTYNIQYIKITYSHIAFNDTVEQELGYKGCGCKQKVLNYAIDLVKDEYITKIDIPLRFAIQTSREQKILDSQQPNKYCFENKQVVGFQFKQTGHVEIKRIYCRKENLGQFDQMHKGQLHEIKFDFDRYKKENWCYINEINKMLIDSINQECLLSLTLDLSWNDICGSLLYYICNVIENCHDNANFRSLDIKMSQRTYGFEYEQAIYDSLKPNDNVEDFSIKFESRFQANKLPFLFEKISQCYGNLQTFTFENTFDEKNFVYLSQSLNNLQNEIKEIKLCLQLRNDVSEDQIKDMIQVLSKLKVKKLRGYIGLANNKLDAKMLKKELINQCQSFEAEINFF